MAPLILPNPQDHHFPWGGMGMLGQAKSGAQAWHKHKE